MPKGLDAARWQRAADTTLHARELPLIVQARFAGSLQSVVKNPTKANGLHLVILVPEIWNRENPRTHLTS